MPEAGLFLYSGYAVIAMQMGSKRGATEAKEATSLTGGTDLNLFLSKLKQGSGKVLPVP